MTPKQERFVAEYLVDLNATQAAIRAGYSEKTAEQSGPRLLGNVEISHAVRIKQEALAQKHNVTLDRVVAEVASVGFANMGDFMRLGANGLPVLDWGKLTREQTGVVSEVTIDQVDGGKDAPVTNRVKLKLYDKLAALDKLARHLGMFPKDGATVNVNISLESLIAASLTIDEK